MYYNFSKKASMNSIDCLQATFQEIKTKLKSAPKLAIRDFECELFYETDGFSEWSTCCWIWN